MSNRDYLTKVLEEKYGIRTIKDLHDAMRESGSIDIGMFRSEPTTERKEHLQCAS